MSRRSRRRDDEDDTPVRVYSPDAAPGYKPVAAAPSPSFQRSLDRVGALLGVAQKRTAAPPTFSAPAVAPYRVSNAERLYPSRIGDVVSPVPAKGGTFKRLVVPASSVTAQTAAKGVSKPSARLDRAGAEALQSRGVDLKGDGGKMCRAVNRPTDTKGDGGSRPFIPWCSRGK